MKVSKKHLPIIFLFIFISTGSYIVGVAIAKKNILKKTTALFYKNQVNSEIFYYKKFSEVIREIDAKNYEKAGCLASESARHIFYVLRQCADDAECRDYFEMRFKSPDLLGEKPPELMNEKNCS